MQKHTTNFLLLLLVFTGMILSYISSVKAQDFLVTIQQDTLNCKIGKLTGDFYPVEFKWDDEPMSGLIHKKVPILLLILADIVRI